MQNEDGVTNAIKLLEFHASESQLGIVSITANRFEYRAIF